MKLIKTALTPPIAAISVAIFAALGVQAAVLEGYTELKYIESTGTQWIDTEYTPGKKTRVVIRFQYTTSGAGTCFGFGASGAAASFRILRQKNADDATQCRYAFNVNDAYGNVRATDYATLDTDEHVADIGNAGMSFDGEPLEKTESGSLTKNVAGTAYLFAMRAQWVASPSADSFFTGRIYSCQIYDGETLVRDFVPVLDANGKPCLLDVAQGHNKAYTNKATKGDDFTPGPVTSRITVKGHPSDYGEPSPGYGEKLDVEVGSDYTFTMPQGVCTNVTKTEVYTCTGWTLVDNEGVETSGPELTKTVNFAGGVYTLTWNWTVEKGHFGRTLTVPSQYATIAAAVEAAEDGDTVLVSDGTYEITAQIEVKKPITLKSVNGAAVTEVKRVNVATGTAADIERCLYLANAEAIVDGFTFSGGRLYNSGGTETADCMGAGVLIDTAGGTLQNSSITNCTIGKSGVYGGGLAMLGTAGVVKNCEISDNRCGYKTVTAIDGWTTYAAGVYMAGGLMEDCVVARNYCDSQNQHSGVGLYAKGGTVRRTVFVDNILHRAEGGAQGAGVWVNGAATFEGCLFARNRVNRGPGGGVYCSGAATFRNCTFADNEAMSAGGLYLGNANGKVYDCVFAGNATYSDATAGAPDWAGNANVVYSNCLATVEFTLKSIDCTVGRAAFLDNDYTLSPGSPLSGVGWKCPARGTADFIRTGRTCVKGADIVLTAGVEGEGAKSYRWKVGSGAWGDYSDSAGFTTSFTDAGTYEISMQATLDGEESAVVTKELHVAETDIQVEEGDDIQSAIDEAEDGTTVHVAAGTYELPDQIVVDKGITLVSDEGREETILNRGATQTVNDPKGYEADSAIVDRCLLVNHPDAVVSGFTLTGGWIYSGNITYNLAASGSGALVGPRGGLLTDTTITACGQARTIKSGALSVVSKQSVASNCTVTANNSKGWITYGAGVWISGGGLVTHTDISQNDNTTGNQIYGGGVYAIDGRLSHCRVTGNTVANQSGGGAGVYATSTGFFCDNCLIDGNVSNGKPGGGVYGTAGNFINCTIVGNSAAQGGGVYGNSANLKFHNCIIQGNAVTGDSSAGAPEWNGTNTKYGYSLSPKALPTANAGNITGSATFEAGSIYKLVAGSAGYDAGDSETAAFVPYLTDTDCDGNDRIWGEKIDIGCYEYFSTERYSASIIPPTGDVIHERTATFTASIVNPMKLDLRCEWTVEGSADAPSVGETFSTTFDVPGPAKVKLTVWDGEIPGKFELDVYVAPHDVYVVTPESIAESGVEPAAPFWRTDCASTNLQLALDAAVDTTVIHVAPGTHLVWQELAVTKGVTLVSDEGPSVTAIRRGDEGRTLYSAKYRVMSVNNPDATVDGFAIENGYLNDQKIQGAGLYIGALGGLVTNCIVRGNYMYANMYTYGGGVYMAGGEMANCVISNNINATQVSDLGSYGGGICLAGGVLRNSKVVGNELKLNVNQRIHTDMPGGGVALIGGSMVNCLVAGNYSDGNAAGVVLMDPLVVGRTITMTNCTITANTAYNANAGAGVRFVEGGQFLAVNALVSGNFGDNGAQAHDEIAGEAGGTLVNCYTGAEPLFRNPARGDYRLRLGSPCVDAGQNADWMEDAKDLRGERRVINGTVDIGCCEFPWNGLMLLVK